MSINYKDNGSMGGVFLEVDFESRRYKRATT